jgi:periplasmic copper chaperone A
MRFLLLAVSLATMPALAQVQVENAWIRPTPPGAKVAAGYMVIKNSGGTADRLVAAASTAAERVETHVTVKDGDILRMRETKGYDIPAKGALELKPGGSHLMFVNVKAPFAEGQKVPGILRFEKAGEVKVEFSVGQPAAAGHGQHKGH